MANSPLQKAPLGLLQAFNLQTLGQSPSLFSDTVVPVVDVWELYTRDLKLVETNGVAGAAGALQLSLTVPANERWLVWQVGAFVTLAVADVAISTYGRLGVVTQGRQAGVSAQRTAILAVQRIDGTAFPSRNRDIAVLLPRPSLLLPTDIVRLNVDSEPTSGTLTATDASLGAWVTVLPA